VEAERRQVTVLFTDMVGFTAFSERAGEEAAFTLMRSLSELMDGAVHEYGGVVQSFTGDGIMAVFGAPVAFEDAPLRACRAALSILRRLKAAADDLEVKHGLRPRLRIGLNTGTAVVGRVQRGADAGVTVLGDTVNVAARLQALTEPDSVFMSEATHRLLQGLVETSFAGEHQIKGKSEPQRVHRLNGIRLGATRFEAAVSRGLSAFVGREREMEVLERKIEAPRAQLRVVDLVAEPGMGKSRLLHEFRQRIGKERAFVLSGSCSPDGQQTAFLPFIEVARGSFRVSLGEAEKEVAQKLELGLTTLGLHSTRNLGLLLHLLGLKVPDDALTGLDGVLIGLRTRELLHQLLEARCRISPVVMVIEDLHWIDSVSAEVLGKIVQEQVKLRLLLVTTRRPEYVPPWLKRAAITELRLEPLPKGDIHRLVQTRLQVDILPETLLRQVADKADGNPLFAEEIVSYLTERGMLRTSTGKLDFDASAAAAVLPTSVQSLLTARVDRLAAEDRVLLQAASVIGRRFDPQVLAVAVGETNIDTRLAAIQALDLIRVEDKSGDFAFKHALVRDALYQSLLTEARVALHAKIAEEIERRSGNRLVEVAEMLAHHYGQTNQTGKAFAYLSMAGSKSLSVYSLEEAATHFGAALALLDTNPDCASDDQVAEFLVSYLLRLNLGAQQKIIIEVVERYLARIDRLENDARVVLIRHQYVFALLCSARFQEAAAQQQTLRIANRLSDSRSKAYAFASEIFVSTFVAPKRPHELETLKSEAVEAATDTADAYIQNWTRYVIGWEEAHRGRMNKAREAARELMQLGQRLNDPRSTALGLSLLGIVALASESFAEALEYYEQSLAVAIAPWDQNNANNGKGMALVLLRQTEEGAKVLEARRRRCLVDGDLITLVVTDGAVAACKALQGNIGHGIRLIEQAILKLEKEGYQRYADWIRLMLGEMYLQIIAGNERPPLLTVLKNLSILLKIVVTAPMRIRELTTRVLENPHFDPSGFHVGHAQMILGLLYKIKKKRALAVQHLSEARRILSQFGETPILARVDTALAELGQ
jgi:class 3 adenylate cyclase/tetratricopeptide (TPR) repeat protein